MHDVVNLTNGLELGFVLVHSIAEIFSEGRSNHVASSGDENEEADSSVELVLQDVVLLGHEESTNGGDEHVGAGDSGLGVELEEPFLRDECQSDWWSVNGSGSTGEVDKVSLRADVEDGFGVVFAEEGHLVLLGLGGRRSAAHHADSGEGSEGSPWSGSGDTLCCDSGQHSG